jgi:hypothetical protein
MTQQPQTAYREVNIEDISETEAFEAWGYVTLKVQRGDEVLGVKVKITSVPQERLDALRAQAPRPPVRPVMLDPSNPDHAALGVTTRRQGMLPDFGDDEYLTQKDLHDLKFRNAVVGLGVAAKLSVPSTGALAVTAEDKYKALEERGLSTFHFAELAQNILQLTQWKEEERENFMKRASASAAAAK